LGSGWGTGKKNVRIIIVRGYVKMRKRDDGIMKINALLRNWQSCTPSPACTLTPWQFGGGNLQKKRCKENVEENVERVTIKLAGKGS